MMLSKITRGFDGSGKLQRNSCSPSASPAAVVELCLRKALVSHSLWAVVALVLLTSCSRHQAPAELKPEGARLSRTQAITIAKQAAERAGRSLADYKDPEAHYEFTRKDKSWSIFFKGRVPMPGNHFSVSVDDPTGEARVIGGL